MEDFQIGRNGQTAPVNVAWAQGSDFEVALIHSLKIKGFHALGQQRKLRLVVTQRKNAAH